MKPPAPWLVKPTIGEDSVAPDPAMDEDDANATPLPPLMGKRGTARLDPWPTGERAPAGPNLRSMGKTPAAELDP